MADIIGTGWRESISVNGIYVWTGNKWVLTSYSGTTNLSDRVNALGGDDWIDGAAGDDNIFGGDGNDTIIGSVGRDYLIGGTGSDLFEIDHAYELAAGETIDGTWETGTTDRLLLSEAGIYDLSGFTTISNIDQIVLGQDAPGFNLIVANSQVSTADFNRDGVGGDLMIRSTVMSSSNGVIINASGLSGVNHIVVDGTNLNGNDTITGGSGADTINAGIGNDTINVATGQFVAGESIDGGAGTDSLNFISTGDGTSVDFSLGSVSSVETLTAVNQGSGNGFDQTFTITATQWDSFTTINMNDGSDTLNVVAAGTMGISAGGVTTVSGVETGNLTGTAGSDTTTLSGAQLDAIIIGAGTINLGAGAGDTINLTSTSSDLNTLGGTLDTSIQGVEAISAATAAAGVTIMLSGQSEGFTVTGSSQADTITGGSGADTINAGIGNDTITGGSGSDAIDGGAGTSDTAIYGGAWKNYEITDNGDGSYTIVDTRPGSPDGADTVRNVELFEFANGTFAASTILNDPPVASNDANSSDAVTEGGGIANGTPGDDVASGNVLANDSDPDNPMGDMLTVVAARAGTETSGGSLTAVNGATAIAGTYGTLHIDPDGTYTYNLDNNSSATEALSAGQIAADQFTYELTDSHGATDLAQIDITIHGSNDGPVAQSDIGVGDPASLPSGLIAYWSADGTTEDAVGSNDGVLQNGASFATGMFGQAFSFDGVDDLFAAPSTGLPTGNSDRTISLWVKADAFTTGESLLAGYGTFGSSGQTYQLGTSGDTLFFSQWGGAVFGPSLQTEQWYNVAVTNVGNSVTLYLDGVAVETGSLPINTPADTEFLIGARPSGGSIPGLLQGEVDGVQVYDRALTAEEIQSIYNTDLSTLPIGNVLSNDTDVDSGDSMSVIGVAAGTSAEDVSGNVGSAVIGIYGSLTLGAEGTWTYARDDGDPDTQQLGQGQAATDIFTYTMADAQGATSTTALTITIHGSTSSSSGTLAFANLADIGSSNSNEITSDESFDLSLTGNDAGTVSHEVSTNGGSTWSPTTVSQTSTAGKATTYTGPIRAGADTFNFSALTDGPHTITDFSPGIDLLRVSAAGFDGGLVAGGAVTLVTAADAASASNGETDGYFIFDDDGASAGTLYFDATGGTGEDAIAIAQFTGLPSFLSSDIGIF
ncbi:VCBS domain-containing protein [Mesorhizobium salmacidum]|uniref:VCBS domain-containing protein n=1 Tax=Mesorhizobium salmacidum TaxID=3015171 RepID=A0ABU8KUD6_9HYPH